MSLRLPRFSDQWTPLDAPPGARLVLRLDADQEAFERQVDRLCRRWHAQAFSSSYLDGTAPFLQNLSMLENLTLPLAWRRGLTLPLVLRRAQPYLESLGWSPRDLQRLCRCRPDDLSDAQRVRAVLLRAALAAPDWLLIDPGWFEHSPLPLPQLIGLAEAVLGQSRWLLFWPASQVPLPGPVHWHTIQLELER